MGDLKLFRALPQSFPSLPSKPGTSFANIDPASVISMNSYSGSDSFNSENTKPPSIYDVSISARIEAASCYNIHKSDDAKNKTRSMSPSVPHEVKTRPHHANRKKLCGT